jgi:hypothetical protein
MIPDSAYMREALCYHFHALVYVCWTNSIGLAEDAYIACEGDGFAWVT